MKLKEFIEQQIQESSDFNLLSTEDFLSLNIDKSEDLRQELVNFFYLCAEQLDLYFPPIISFVIAKYGGDEDDWVELEGVPSGVGVDYWFKNKKTGQEVYVNNDQGVINID